MFPPSRRLGNALGFVACAAMMAYAFYAQYGLGLEPCPLCMFQRVGVVILGAMFLIAALHNPRSVAGARVYAALLALAAAFPLYVSGRHVYIQSLPFGSVPAASIANPP